MPSARPWRSFLKHLFHSLCPRRTNKRSPAFRPLLLPLEDRLAPATLIVSTTCDNTSDTSVLTLREAITLVNNDGNPASLGQPNMPAGWASQISGAFGDNDTIEFSSTLSGDTITLNGTALAISASVTIGGGAQVTISGGGQSSVFDVVSPNLGLPVSLVGLNIIDGDAGQDGNIGGIYSYGTALTLNNCMVSGNQGGGVYNDFGTLSVVDSTISGNSDGPGIESEGTLTVNGSTISGNSTGGGISGTGTMTLAGSTLANNSATYTGGAIQFEGSSLAVNNCTFTDNSSGDDAGGIFVGPRTTATVTNSTFTGNSTGETGGAIEVDENHYAGALVVNNCTFDGNSAGVGGAIAIDGGNSELSATLTGSTFSGNSAEFGGAVSNSGPLTVVNCTFSGNSADVAGSFSEGGGIDNSGGTLTVNDSTLSGNSASTSGGGIANTDGGSVILNNTIVAGSTAGGDLYQDSGYGSTFSGDYDLIGDGSEVSSFGTHTLQGEPQLAPLGYYGGPTQTMPLLGTLGAGAGNTSLATDGSGNALMTDQRGVGFPRTLNGTVDIGAVETDGASLAGIIQQVLSPTTPVTVQANTSSDADAVIAAVNQLPDADTPSGTVTLNLAPGVSYSDVDASPPEGVTLVITGQNGTTIVGQSPALTVSSGTVIVTGMTLSTSTADPTVLVSGGSLQLLNDTVESSTSAAEACVSLTGGSLDLGTNANPGGDTFNINGTGNWFANTTANPISFGGDTFEINGAAQSVVTWTGADNNGIWDDAKNWFDSSGNYRVPGSNDVALITQSGITVTLGDGSTQPIECLQSQGNVVLSSDSLTIADPSTISGVLTISGGSLDESGNVSIGTLDWTGGDITGTGTVTVTGSATIAESDPNVALALLQGTLELEGATTWVDSNIGSGTTQVTIINDGTLSFQNSTFSAPVNFANLFINNGTIEQDSAGTTTIEASFTNSGCVNIGQGTFELISYGTTACSGSIYGAPGTTLDLGNEEQSFAPSSSITGDQVMISGSVAGYYSASTTITNGSATFTGTIANLGAVDNAAQDAILTIDPTNQDPITLASLIVGYEVTSTVNVNVQGSMTMGVILDGSGTFYAEGGLVFNNDNSDSRLLCPLVNEAACQWTNSQIYSDSAGTFTNAPSGTVVADGDDELWTYYGDSAGSFENDGAFIEQTNSYVTFYNYTPFNESTTGTVCVQAGSTFSTNTGTVNNSIVGAPGTMLYLGGNFTSTSSISGYQVSIGGTVAGSYFAATSTTVPYYGTATFTGTIGSMGAVSLPEEGNEIILNLPHQTSVTMTSLDLDDAFLDTNNTVVVQGLLSVYGVLEGTGTVYAEGGLYFDNDPDGYLLCPLVNEATCNWTNSTVQIEDTGTFTNAPGGTVLASGDDYWPGYDGTTATFENQGTFIEQGSTTSVAFGVPFDNSGTVDVQGGTFSIPGGTSSGSFTGVAGTTLTLSGDFTPTSSISGDRVTISGTVAGYFSATTSVTVVNNNAVFLGTVAIDNATLDIYQQTMDLTEATLVDGNDKPAGTAANPLDLNAVYLFYGNLLTNAYMNIDGPGTFTFNTGMQSEPDAFSFLWNGGSLSGAGITLASGTTNFLGYGNTALNANLINEGTTIESSNLILGTGATVENEGTCQLWGNFEILSNDSSGNQFINEPGAAFIEAVPAQFITDGYPGLIEVPFINDANATVEVAQGGLEFTDATLTNGGTISGATGTGLAIAEPLIEQIGGDVAGVDYGQITSGYNVVIEGSLSVVMENGYIPAPGTVFNIEEALSGSADFNNGSTVAAPGIQSNGDLYTSFFNVENNSDVVQLKAIDSFTAAANDSSVTSSGYQTATDTGTYTNPEGAVTLTASLGTVVITGNGTWSWTYTPDDGPTDTQTVTITATDASGDVASTTFCLTLNHLPPTASLSGPFSGVLYQPLAFTLGANDESPVDQAGTFIYTINWGDGTNTNPDFQTVTGSSATIATHAYTTAGTFTVTLTATDEDGGESAAVSESVAIISTPQLQNGVLAIPGTASAATITLTPNLPSGATAYSMKVTETIGSTTTNLGTYAVPTGDIEIYGGPGPDSVYLYGTTNVDAFSIGNGSVSEIAGETTADATSFSVGLNSIPALILNGDGGSDSLTGSNQSNTWDITGANSGTLDGTTSFSKIDNLIGGMGINEFAFGSGSLTGTVTGGSGSNTLDFSEQSTAITVTLVAGGTNKATGTGGWTNIQTILGSSTATNTLVGGNINNVWNISGANAGTLDGSLSFSGFENLTGGSADDTFSFLPGGSVAGNINGKAPVNALDYAAYDSPVTVNLGSTMATAIGGTWSNIQDFTGTDTSDTLIGSNSTSTWSISGTNTGTVGAYTYSGFPNLAAGTGTNNFEFVNPGMLTGTIVGGGGSDTITGDNNGDSFTISGSNSGSIAAILPQGFIGINDLTGGSGNNTYAFVNGGSIAGNLSGGSGTNKLLESGYGSPVTVDLATKTATGIGGTWTNLQNFVGTNTFDTLLGANAASAWTIIGLNVGTVGADIFSGFSNLQGGSGKNTYTFTGAGSESGNIAGGSGSSNSLNFSGYNTPVTVDVQGDTATGIGGTWAGIQSFAGTNTTDTLIAANGASNDWELKGSNAGTINGLAFTGFANLIGGGGSGSINTFTFANGAVVTGSITGGSGASNTLNYSAYTGGVTVNLGNATTGLASDSATMDASAATYGVFNIGSVIVGSGGNFLTAVGVASNVSFIATGNGENVLIGGSGTNTLTAIGSGDNIIIGGQGASTITGGTGYDLLIGGSTVYDGNYADLEGILGVWEGVKSTATYNAAVASLSNPSSTYSLIDSITVIDNPSDSINPETVKDWIL